MSIDIDHPSSDSLTFEDVMEILEQELEDQMYDEEDEEIKELDFNE